MKIAMYYGPEDVRIEERPSPVPGAGEIVVQNRVTLTCGTDVKTFFRGHPYWTPPAPFGHESAGVVIAAGEGAPFAVGDRVVAHNSAPCGTCYFCKQGQHSLCDRLTFNLGAFAEIQKIPAVIVSQNTFLIPPEVSCKDAALTEPFACALYGIEQSEIKLGDTVVVNGAGPIGLMLIRLAVLRGARVIATDLHPMRLELARKLGAAVTIDIRDVSDQVQAVKAYTEEERGADVAIEAAGFPELWEKTVAMVRKGGIATLFGGPKPGTTVTFDTKLLHYSQMTIKGVFHTTPRHVKAAFDLICRGVISAVDFVNEEYRLQEIEQAIRTHAQGLAIKNAIVYP
jgi:L-iditol 2-dehydrogenase